jgi:cholesterol oxidase
MKQEYDFVIIGSGFGGSVSALRLSEKGYKVLVIEKGKWYQPRDFATTNWNLKKWLWLPQLKLFGIQKLNFLSHVNVMSGVGVGGGSLVYAATLIKPRSFFFSNPSWAQLGDWENELAPYYTQAQTILGANPNPKPGPADEAMQKLAENSGISGQYSPATAGIFFGEPEINVADPYFDGKGPERSGCRHCGACMTGCRYNAKNSLDKNYLYLAQNFGAQIMAEHKVTGITPKGAKGNDGYMVEYKSSVSYFAKTKAVTTKGVIFSGGVLGTVCLLQKLRKTTLPELSPCVGNQVRTNNEALIHITTYAKNPEFHKGIAIGSMLEVDDNSFAEPVRYGEGSGFWRFLMAPMLTDKKFGTRLAHLVRELWRDFGKWAKVLFVRDFSRSTLILLFMQHLDSTLSIRKRRFSISTKLSEGPAPTPYIPVAQQMARQLAEIIEGKPLVMFNELLVSTPSTAHILGGACMAKNATEGVIDSENRVFGYRNMYVFDGSMISANPGVNPSLTIAAITERGMRKIPAKETLKHS